MNKINNLRYILEGAPAALWKRQVVLRGLALALLVGASTALPAAEIRVLSGGAAKALVAPLTESFQSASGQRVQLVFEPRGTLGKALAAGCHTDLRSCQPLSGTMPSTLIPEPFSASANWR